MGNYNKISPQLWIDDQEKQIKPLQGFSHQFDPISLGNAEQILSGL